MNTNIINSLLNVTIFKSTYFIGIISILIFIAHLFYNYALQSRDPSDDKPNIYDIDKGPLSFSTSLIKEIHLFVLDICLILITLVNYSSPLRYLMLTAVPFAFSRLSNIFNNDKGFLENEEIKKPSFLLFDIFGDTYARGLHLPLKLINYIGYLIIPLSFLFLKIGIYDKIGNYYLYGGVIILFLFRLINLISDKKNNYTSETLVGSLIEGLGFSLVTGIYFFNNIIAESTTLFVNSKGVMSTYFVIVLIIIALVYRMINNKNNKEN